MEPKIAQNSYNVFEEVPRLMRNFPQDDLRHFLSLGRVIHFKPFDRIVTESEEPANAAFLIARGRVNVTKEGVKLSELSEGDFMGEAFLFTQAGRLATVTAETDAVVLRFEREDVLDYFRKKPEKLFKLFILNIIDIQQRKIDALNIKFVECRRKKEKETEETHEY
jgi:CRP-like cAMP-binding protein